MIKKAMFAALTLVAAMSAAQASDSTSPAGRREVASAALDGAFLRSPSTSPAARREVARATLDAAFLRSTSTSPASRRALIRAGAF